MIKELRTQLGMSQLELAMHIGVSRSHLAMVESGRKALNNDKHFLVTKMFIAANGGTEGIIPAAPQRDLGPGSPGKMPYNDLLQREYNKYWLRYEKVKSAIRCLENKREKKAKQFAHSAVLEQVDPRPGMPTLSYSEIFKAPPLPGNDNELLCLQIKKCSYEAALNFLKERGAR